MIGSRFGQFEITAKLGEGGMGVVYEALDHELDRKVAELAARLTESYKRRPGYWVGYHFQALAEIHLLLGSRDDAVEYLERMLNSPSFFSAAAVKIDPTWRDLTDHPDFIAMLDEHGG